MYILAKGINIFKQPNNSNRLNTLVIAWAYALYKQFALLYCFEIRVASQQPAHARAQQRLCKKGTALL